MRTITPYLKPAPMEHHFRTLIVHYSISLPLSPTPKRKIFRSLVPPSFLIVSSRQVFILSLCSSFLCLSLAISHVHLCLYLYFHLPRSASYCLSVFKLFICLSVTIHLYLSGAFVTFPLSLSFPFAHTVLLCHPEVSKLSVPFQRDLSTVHMSLRESETGLM